MAVFDNKSGGMISKVKLFNTDEGRHTIIFIDINHDDPNNQIYIDNNRIYYKAEASSESIQQIIEFINKIK